MSPRKRAVIRSKIDLDLVISLDEQEALALDALVGYGIKPFLKVFYEHMGRAYLEPHEAGLVSLFETINECVRPSLGMINKAREALKDVVDSKP